MTQPQRVTVISRDNGMPGMFVTVRAQVDDGATGDYQIARDLVGTPGELAEIRAQSMRRMEAMRALRPAVP